MNGPEVKLYPCTVCGQEFENRNSMANHVRWTHKEKKFSDEGYANLKRTAFKQVNERKSISRGCAITVFKPCPKCKSIFKVKGFSKRMSRMKNFCSQKCANSKDWTNHPDRERIKESRRKSVLERPNGPWGEKSQDYKGRFSSKAERSLAEALGQDFRRHSLVRSDHLTFDVDIVSKDGKVWIESDGPYHFGKVHRNHDFEKSRQRDEIEGEEALKRCVLLIRVNNFKYTIEEQARFVRESISSWDGNPRVMCLY
jgi:hypothetical protein